MQRRGLQRRWYRTDQPQAAHLADHRCGWFRSRPLRGMAPGEEGHRHRRLLRELLEVDQDDRMEALGRTRRWTKPDGVVLSSALRSLRRSRQSIRGACVTGRRIPFADLGLRDDAVKVR